MSPTHEIKVNGKGDGRKITNMELRGYHDQRGTRGKGESQIGAEMLHQTSSVESACYGRRYHNHPMFFGCQHKIGLA